MPTLHKSVRRRIRSYGYCIAAVSAALGVSSAHAETTPNILLNPGAETGTLANWSPAGSSHPGIDNGAFDPGISPVTGSFDFIGGAGSSGTLTQSVSLNGFAPTFQQIDTGTVSFNISLAERSLAVVIGSPDVAGAIVTFFSGSTPVSSGLVPEFASTAGWQGAGTSANVGVGSRTFQYQMLFDRNSGTDLDSFIDNNSVTLSYFGSSWKGAATGNWSNASAWNSGVPIAGGPALLTSAGGAANITFDGNYANTSLSELYVDATGVGMHLNQAVNTMTAATEYIGNVANGTYQQTGGANAVSSVFLGYYAGSNGNYLISNGTLNVSANLYVGYNGNGGLAISNGSIQTTSLIIGANSGSNSFVVVDAGTIKASSVIVGGNGAAILDVSGGTLFASSVQVASATSSIINLSSGTLSLGSLNLEGNLAHLNWTGGTLAFTGNMDVDTNTGPLGSLVKIQPTQTLSVNGILSVGTTASAILTQNGGVISANTVYLGAAPSLSGSLDLLDPSAGFTATNLFVGGTVTGSAGTGFINLSQGSMTVSQLTIWNAGVVNLNGGTLSVGSFSPASNPQNFHWTDGNLTFLSDITINPQFILGDSVNLQNGKTLAARNLTNDGLINLSTGASLSVTSLSNDLGGVITSSGNISLTSTATSTNIGLFNTSGPFVSSNNFINFANFTLSGPQSWKLGTTFTNIAGNATFASNAGPTTPSLTISISGGSVLFSASQNLTALTLSNFGQAAISAGAIKTNTFLFAGAPNNWQGLLDLRTQALIVEAVPLSKSTILSTLQNQVVFARTHSAGITSSTLPANFGIATLDNAVTNFTTFFGQSVDANSLLVASELLGDANVDGHVDLTDLSIVLNNFGTVTSSWTSGNFDGGATIDLSDLSDVLNNFGLSNPSAHVVLSPEPASLTLIAASLPFFLRRRQK